MATGNHVVTPWDTAIHEASHIIVALALGKEVTYARIRSTSEGGGGKTDFADEVEDWKHIDKGDGLDPGPKEEADRLQRRAMTICVAGDVGNKIDRAGDWNCISERVDEKTYYRRTMEDRGRMKELEEVEDLNKALTWADQLPEEPLREIKMAEEQAERILKEKWEEVLLIAKRLFEQRFIGRNQIRVLLGR
jgi:hypothetical protein